MGPTLILDKSSLQSFSPAEIHFIYKYFVINIPPVLIIEILADLKKDQTNDSSAQNYVSQLSKKLLSRDSAINVYFSNIITSELLGNRINMSERILKGGGELYLEENKKGVVFDESPEEKAVKNWQQSRFDDADKNLAERWRLYTDSLNPEKFKDANKEVTQYLQDYKNLDELNELVESLIDNQTMHTNLLVTIINEFYISSNLATKIFYLWESKKKPDLRKYAPYTVFCLKVLLLYYFGTLKSQFGRATDKIDLEYIYYLPFTNIISSDDKFFKRIIPFCINSNQLFVTGKELKSDLFHLTNDWKELSKEEKIKWQEINGNEPTKETPLIFSYWQKYFPSWSPGFNKSKKVDQSKLDELKNRRGKRIKSEPTKKDFEDLEKGNIDFIEVESYIRLSDPCPCGSGVPFKDCHYKQK